MTLLPDPDVLDRIILSKCVDRWRKVARILVDVGGALDMEANDIVYAALVERVKHLVAIGQLDSQGNLDKWRFSEVRLPLETW